MGSEPVVNAAIALSWGSSLLVGASYIVLNSIYDARQAGLSKKIAKQPYRKKLRQKPLVSVIVVMHNNESCINDCLDSIRKAGCRKYEIIVIDNSSSDQTKKIIKEYAKDHPKVLLKLSHKRKEASGTEALRQGLRKVKGKKVLLLEPTHKLAPKALKNALNSLLYSETDSYLVETEVINLKQAASLAKTAEKTLFLTPTKKAAAVLKYKSLVNTDYLYNLESLKELLKSKKTAKESYLKFLSALILTSWLILIVYFSYIATAHNYPAPFGLSLLALLVYACFMTLGDASFIFKDRFKTVLTLPGSLTLLYFLTVIKGLSAIVRPLKFNRFRSS